MKSQCEVIILTQDDFENNVIKVNVIMSTNFHDMLVVRSCISLSYIRQECLQRLFSQ